MRYYTPAPSGVRAATLAATVGCLGACMAVSPWVEEFFLRISWHKFAKSTFIGVCKAGALPLRHSDGMQCHCSGSNRGPTANITGMSVQFVI